MNKAFITSLFLLVEIIARSQSQSGVQPAIDFLSGFDNTRDFTVSNTNREAYFTVQSPNEESSVIVVVKQQLEKWSEPQLVPFTGRWRDIEPFLSPDQLRLYFSSNRPMSDTATAPKDYDIWYVERKNIAAAWSAPINLGSPVNTEHDEFYPSVSRRRHLYFTSDAPRSTGKDDIFFSRWDGAQYTLPVPLDTSINSAGYEFNAFVSPEEDFLIYTKYGQPGGLGSGDLYISYKNALGNWEPATNLGKEVNTKYMDYCPFYDERNEVLYFTSRRSSVPQKKFQSLAEFEKAIHQYENGFSRIYKTGLKIRRTR